MKAYEKFEARLHELGLYDEWIKQGGCGRIAKVTENGITILCNEGEDDKAYSESHFPHISEMAQYDMFRFNALYEFCDHDDTHFIYNLCRWVARPDEHKCPLYPVDVYFCWDSAETIFFEDDAEETIEDVLKHYEKTEEWCPHCDEAVELEHELKVQKCPNCGKWIVPCSVCPLTDCSAKCPLERLGILLNK